MRYLKFLFALLPALVMIRCGNDNNNPTTPALTTPTIVSVTPTTVNRGQRNVTMTIRGTNLSGVTGVAMGSQITVHGYREINPTELQTDFSVSTDAVPGTRTISVIAAKGTASAASLFSVASNVVPVAAFKVTPNSGTQIDDFEFDGSESYDTGGTITDYSWDFNDGQAAHGKKVTHKFEPGTYQVKLTVTDNSGASSFKTKQLDVEPFSEQVCTEPVRNHGLIYGTVIAVEPGNNAIVQLDNDKATCASAFYRCGDMRDAEVDLGFFGIVMQMADRGKGVFRVQNSCPYHWPPKIGQRVFLFYKSCEENHC